MSHSSADKYAIVVHAPEPEVRPVVHVGLVAVVDLAAKHLGQGEPRAEGPRPAESHPDHLDIIMIIIIIVVVVIIIIIMIIITNYLILFVLLS